MPNKNGTLSHGQRYTPLNRKLYKRFVEETGLDIGLPLFKEIIRKTCYSMGESVATESEGIQFPSNLGYLVVTKYKPNKSKQRVLIDSNASKKVGKAVPFLNLHSFGYLHNIRWYKFTSTVRYIDCYGLYPTRPMKRLLASNIKAGTQFFSWNATDLWSLSKMERRFYKRFKKDE